MKQPATAIKPPIDPKLIGVSIGHRHCNFTDDVCIARATRSANIEYAIQCVLLIAALFGVLTVVFLASRS